MPRRNAAAFVVPFAPGLPDAVSLPGRHGAPTAPPAGSAAWEGPTAPATVLRRVTAAGHPAGTRDLLGELWGELRPRDRHQLAAPLLAGRDGLLRLGSTPAVQSGQTHCGAAVLTLVAAAGDPVVAAWLVTGRLVGALPGSLTEATAAAATTPAERFAAAQDAMLRTTSRHGLGPLPWPSRFGTAPWAAARHARFPGVRYTHRPVDDGDADAMARVTAWIAASAGRGVPVPLYTGGDLGHGLATAVPRHVVLAVPAPDLPADSLAIYEPAGGRVHVVPVAELVARTAPHPALGQWIHVCWAVLPRAARRLP